MRKYTSLIIIILYTTVKSNYSNFGSNGDAFYLIYLMFSCFLNEYMHLKKNLPV